MQKAFIKACKNGDIETVKQFLSENDAICWENTFGYVVDKLFLADKRVNPADDNNLAIRLASEYGHVEVVKLLLADKRVNPAAAYNEAIISASIRGHTEVVRLLLADPRVKPDDDDEDSAICGASKYGHVEVVRLLLADPRVNPTSNDNDAIRASSSYDHVEVVKLLLADKRVNPKGENGIRIIFNGNSCVKFEDIVVFDNVLCEVENENVNSIKDPVIREKYLLWLYRIGGEKWAQAKENLK